MGHGGEYCGVGKKHLVDSNLLLDSHSGESRKSGSSAQGGSGREYLVTLACKKIAGPQF